MRSIKKARQALDKREINSFFFKKLAAFQGSASASDEFDKCLDLSKKLSSIGVSTDDEYEQAIKICSTLYQAYGKIDDAILKSAYNACTESPPSNLNDYYYLVLKAVMENKTITKKAYPTGMGALTDEPPEEVDMDKWSKLVHKIFDTVSRGQMSLHDAVENYSGVLDKKSGEDVRFKRWIKYYLDGEHMKYSKDKEEQMQKKSVYQFSPHGIGFYTEDTKSIDIDEELSKAEDQVNKTEDFRMWKSKLNGAIRRIDKLLRNSEEFLDADKYEELVNLLHDFDVNVGRTRLQSTASDLTYKTAGKFNKLGFSQIHDELVSVAQEAPPPEAQPIEADEPLETPPAVPQTPGAPAEQQQAEEAPEPDPVDVKDLNVPSGARPGEYEELSGDASLEQANAKLEEVAAVLADRRVVRLLAEFDIMLDKLGIASHFMELTEAQSKLMDSYGYALTRVTKMLGMLSSGRTLLEAQQGGEVPGAEAPVEQPEGGAIQEEFGMPEEPMAPEAEAPVIPGE